MVEKMKGLEEHANAESSRADDLEAKLSISQGEESSEKDRANASEQELKELISQNGDLKRKLKETTLQKEELERVHSEMKASLEGLNKEIEELKSKACTCEEKLKNQAE